MLDRLRDLWAERPAFVAAAVIAPITFIITLVILIVVVRIGDGDTQNAEALADAQQEQADDENGSVAGSSVQQTTVVVDTSAPDSEQQASDVSQQVSSAQDDPPAEESDSPSETQQEQTLDQDATQSSEQDTSEDSAPRMVGGWVVQPLEDVLESEFDEDELRHGTDGLEGGILPIDNGVVVSSKPEQRTTWELIVPSAGLKSTIVEVGRTNSGAMGSPDNPYVIGWLNSSAAPGEEGNTLLAGHRDFEDKDGNVGTGVCWELVNTVEGDQMIVRDNESNIYYVYTVTEAATVNPHDPDAGRYLQNTDEPVMTLITCEGSFNADTHQYSHRRVVVGVLAAVASPDA